MEENYTRFKIVGRPQLALPACSFISRTDDDEFFVDVGIQVDYFGAVYIGSRDLHDMASIAGYIKAEVIADLVAEKEKLQDELAVLRESEYNLSRILGDIGRYAEERRQSEKPLDLDGGNAESDAESNAPTSDGATRSGKTPNERPAKPNSGAKSKSVPDDANPLGL